jgi:DNA-binding NarL/FixJ family response regulator
MIANDAEDPDPFADLRPSELKVVDLVVQGCSNREIAEKLRIPTHIVKRRLCRIFDKLEVSTRLELILLALRHRGAAMTEDAGDPDRFADLTAQEKRVAALVAQGYTNREVAAKLGMAEDAVQHDLCNVYDKVGVSTRLELAYLVLRHRGPRRT